jgi:hypothetical protein
MTPFAVAPSLSLSFVIPHDGNARINLLDNLECAHLIINAAGYNGLIQWKIQLYALEKCMTMRPEF